jgi:peptide/nickel transport system substrate-binding protein
MIRFLVFIVALVVNFQLHAQTLKWSSQGDIQTLDPHSQNELLTNSVNGQVYESLLRRDKQLNLVPALAASWRQLGSMQWQMSLRQNVLFHDGSAFTADDVVFSIKRAQNSSSPFQLFANGLGEPSKIDSHTVEFRLTRANPIFLHHAANIAIMNKKWSETNGAVSPHDFKTKETKYTTFNANGTGPFILISREPDIKTIFRRNSRWWGISGGDFEGNLQEVVYLPVKSDATRTAGLLSGELDLVLDPVPQDMPRLKSAVKVIEGAENRIIFIGMDQARDELLGSSVKGRNPFKDQRVRKALYLAIDSDALTQKIMRGYAKPTGNITHSPKSTFDDPEFEKRLPFDLAQARGLMREAGYAEGFEVVFDCPNNRYINDEEICLALSAMWAQIGLKVKVNAMPRAIYFPKLEKLDTSLYLFGWGSPVTDAETTLTPLLRSRVAGGIGFSNFGNFSSSEIDKQALASSAELDVSKRMLHIKAAIREHNAQVHHIPLHRQMIPWAMRPNVDVIHRSDNWLEWRWITIK